MVGNLAFIAITLLMGYILLYNILMFSAVMSGSMTGTVNKGDLIMMTTAFEDLKTGDIIMFKAPDINYPVTHRVYEITPAGIRTKGDVRDNPDNWIINESAVYARAILFFGKPVVVPKVGNYFIVGDEEMNRGAQFQHEYQTTKRLIYMIRSYGIVIFLVVIFYAFSDTFRRR